MIAQHEVRLGSCVHKILHSRTGCARNDTDNAFSAWMRSEAKKLGAIAHHLFPDAERLPRGDAACLAQRTAAVMAADGTVAGATFAVEAALCRVDFAVRRGTALRLYQVVPSCVDLEQHRRFLEFQTQAGTLRNEWRGHLEDMALRVWIVQQLWPLVLPVHLPHSGSLSQVEGLHSFFGDRGGISSWTTWRNRRNHTDDRVGENVRLWSKFWNRGLERALQNADACSGYRCKCEFHSGSGQWLARCWGRWRGIHI